MFKLAKVIFAIHRSAGGGAAPLNLDANNKVNGMSADTINISPGRDDIATVIALAAMAICTTAFAHEGLGHGSVCLAFGGHIDLLNNAFFRCSAHSPWIALGGPLGNLFVGLLAFVAQGAISPKRPALRFYGLCVMGFSLYWEAGYLVAAMARNYGDAVFAWEGFFGRANWTVRSCGIAFGVMGYFVIARMLAMRLRPFADTPGRVCHLLRPAWTTGVLVMVMAAALYAPDRFGAVRDAGLSVVAAFPLLSPFARLAPAAEPATPITRDTRILTAGAIVFLTFALTMGHGIY